MTEDQIEAFFEEHEDEFLKNENIKPERRLHPRPDLNAFLLLHRLHPNTEDMVSGAEHDKIWLAVEIEELHAASEDDLLDLMRCGVMLDDCGLSMFA